MKIILERMPLLVQIVEEHLHLMIMKTGMLEMDFVVNALQIIRK